MDHSLVSSLSPEGSPPPIARFSPGIAVGIPGGKFVFVSGQSALDEHGKIVGEGDVAAQTEQTYRNIAGILAAVGGTLSHLVSVTIYLVDIGDFAAVSAIRNRLMGEIAPASTLVEVSKLPHPLHRIEITATAFIPGAA